MAAETQAKTPATGAPAPEKPAGSAAVEVKKEVTETKPETKVEDVVKKPIEGESKKEEEHKEEEPTKEEPKKEEGGEKEEPKAVEEPVDPVKKALDELKQLLSAAIANKEFCKKKVEEEKKPAEEPKKDEAPEEPKKEEVTEEPKKPAVEEKKEEPAKPEEKEEKKEEPKKPENLKEEKKEEPKKPENPKEGKKPEAKPAEPIKPEEKQKGVVIEEKKPEEKEKLKQMMEQEKKAEDDAKREGAIVEEKGKEVEPKKEVEELKQEAEEPKKQEEEPEEEEEPPSLWGVSLLDEGEKHDTLLLKFLRARDMKPKEALAMIKATVEWRRSFGADGLPAEQLAVPLELEKAVFMHGVDRESHPVCYNVSGPFDNKQIYDSAFGDEEKRKTFLRWRIGLQEKGILELLDFGDGGVSSMVQVNDMKGAPWLWKKEVRQSFNEAFRIFQDNYPEFVATQVFINCPWWYLAYNRVISPFIDQRTKNKFVHAGPSKSAEMLFKYVAPEQVPVQFGGLSKEKDPDFTSSDAVTDVSIKPWSKYTVEIPVSESCVAVWELRVLGWDVSYGAEFVPDAEGGYTIIVQKSRKVAPTDEPVEKNSFKVGEAGKIVLTIDNTTSKKKKLLYRHKIKSIHD